jgi:simple sugar transport system permease protein
VSTELDTPPAILPDEMQPPMRGPRHGMLRRRLSGTSRLLWPLLALIAILLFNYFFTPGFFHLWTRDGKVYGSLIDILNRGSPVMLLSLGMTIVIATGGIDLSVGAVMAISGAAAAVLIARPEGCPLSALNVHGSLWGIVGISLLLALIAGLWNGVLVAFVDVQPIVATLILMVAGRGLAQLIENGQIVTFEHPTFSFIGSGYFLSLPFTVTIVVIATIFFIALTRWTALGLFIESVGNNPTASRYSGINARSVKLLCYTLCGLCAGLAGLIDTSNISAADSNNVGMYLELDAILAVSIGGTALIGGRFSLLGSIIGALVIQALTTTILTQGVPQGVTLVVKAGVVVGVCMLQSEKFRAIVLKPFRRASA